MGQASLFCARGLEIREQGPSWIAKLWPGKRGIEAHRSIEAVNVCIELRVSRWRHYEMSNLLARVPLSDTERRLFSQYSASTRTEAPCVLRGLLRSMSRYTSDRTFASRPCPTAILPCPPASGKRRSGAPQASFIFTFWFFLPPLESFFVILSSREAHQTRPGTVVNLRACPVLLRGSDHARSFMIDMI